MGPAVPVEELRLGKLKNNNNEARDFELDFRQPRGASLAADAVVALGAHHVACSEQKQAAIAACSDVSSGPEQATRKPTDEMHAALKVLSAAPARVAPVDLAAGRSERVGNPCESCHEQPCLSACPVSAFAPDRPYNAAACRNYLKEGAADCLTQAYAARRACPVASEMHYGESQATFHIRAFLGNRLVAAALEPPMPKQATSAELDHCFCFVGFNG
jgi:hypothetical protein